MLTCEGLSELVPPTQIATASVGADHVRDSGNSSRTIEQNIVLGWNDSRNLTADDTGSKIYTEIT